MRSRFNNFYTTNSTYGSFYEDIKNKVKQDQEQQRRQSNQYEYSHPNYSNNYHNNNNSNTINRTKTPVLPLHDSSIVGSITTSLTGLINLGNTCYINTSLQNLIHCTPFIAKFLEVSNNILQRKTNSTPISEAFYELLLQIYDNNNQEDYINPGGFVEKFTSIHNQFYGNQEHDTQEFCRFLLQDFNCELNMVTNPSIYKKEMAYDRDKKKMFKNYKKDCHSKENSIITETFI